MDCGGGLQAAVARAKGSNDEYFGLETEATSERLRQEFLDARQSLSYPLG